MKYSMLFAAFLTASSLFGANQNAEVIQQTEIRLVQAEQELAEANSIIEQNNAEMAQVQEAKQERILQAHKTIHISVTGQGVAPMNTTSPAQAYALAKRAAIADAYRAIAEKVKGVRVDGQDLIKNMMVKRSTIRTSVKAMVRNANIVETTFKEGLCEVEMEIVISHADFVQ